MSVKVSSWVWGLESLTDNAPLLVLLALADAAKDVVQEVEAKRIDGAPGVAQARSNGACHDISSHDLEGSGIEPVPAQRGSGT